MRRRVLIVVMAVAIAAAFTLASGQIGQGQTPSSNRPGVAAHNPNASPQQKLAAQTRSEQALGLQQVRSAVRASASDQFSARRVNLDLNGASHVRFDRTYAGLPVLGGDFIVHSDAAGTVQGVSSTLAQPLSLSTTPKLPAARALAVAKRHLAAQGAKLQRAGTPSLVVGATQAIASPSLAWRVELEGTASDGVPSRLTVLVSAADGRVLDSWDEVHRAAGNGSRVGSVQIDTTQSGGQFLMRDPLRGQSEVRNANGGQSCNSPIITDADNVWGNGALTDTQSKGVDASYAHARLWDYLGSVLGRNGVTGAGGRDLAVVNSANQNNAFWNGTCAVFFDGAGGANPFTSIDVVAHEFGHGIVQFTAGLFGGPQPGALNESSGDIFGALTEFHASNPNDPADYLVGEELSGGPLRNMPNPAAAGDPNCANTSETEVHALAGPPNHAFFMMAEGSGATPFGNSPTCNGSTVTGIGRNNAGRIWLKALDDYMPSTGGFTSMRGATLNAARDLFGLCSAQYRTVQAAWSAVTVSGSDAPCTGQTTTTTPPTSGPTTTTPPTTGPTTTGPTTTVPPGGRSFTNDTDYLVFDFWTIYSPIAVDLPGQVQNPVRVTVRGSHSCTQGLRIVLIEPRGARFTVKDSGTGACTPFTEASASFNVGGLAVGGNWVLEFSDTATGNSGSLDSWTITL